MTEAQRHAAAALGRIPSGIFILTARRDEAETGMLASWVQQCSFRPLQISLALKKQRPLASWLHAGAAFTLNILAEGQKELVAHFGRGFELDQAAFQGMEVDRKLAHGPVLKEALAYLECRVSSIMPAGD